MKIFAIGDLHLSGCADKPMNVFGANWDGHLERIRNSWSEVATDDDLILIPGDISWAMRLEDALFDLHSIADLPGKKLIMRGNHDYWWSSLSRLRDSLPENMFALQNDSFTINDLTICGSRGWTCPGSGNFKEETDKKLYERELMRLELSLESAPKDTKLIGMLHYPPFNERRQPSGFTQLFEKYGAKYLIYGHLHDKACKNAFEGNRNGIEYMLCSADYLDFKLKFVTEL